MKHRTLPRLIANNLSALLKSFFLFGFQFSGRPAASPTYKLRLRSTKTDSLNRWRENLQINTDNQLWQNRQRQIIQGRSDPHLFQRFPHPRQRFAIHAVTARDKDLNGNSQSAENRFYLEERKKERQIIDRQRPSADHKRIKSQQTHDQSRNQNPKSIYGLRAL